MASDADPGQAVEAWRRLLGRDRVSTTPQVDGYGDSTLVRAEAPAGSVKVKSKEEVADVVRIAARHGVAVYPISRGKNWGYGDACPVGPGQFVLDLSGMDRILEVDPELAYAVIEPGVTQGQLAAHLEENAYPLIGSSTDSSPQASVLGNLIERGFGMTPYSDHAGHVSGMEVVLADGSVIETGMGHYSTAPSRELHRWGVGPQLDGLFTQSNLGVVVRAGVWLMPRPDAFTTFRLTIDGEAGLEEAIDRIRRLRLDRTLRSPVFVANCFRTLAQMSTYPWERTGGKTPLPRETAESILSEMALPGLSGDWNATGSLHGTRRGMAAAARDLRLALRGLGRLHFSSPATSDKFSRRGRALSRLRPRRGSQIAEMAETSRAEADVFRGVPSTQGLGISRWRLRRTPEGSCEDPTGEGSGLYWIAPICPARGAEVRRCVSMIEEQMLAGGFEPLVRVAVANDRAVFVTTLLAFDRREPEESRRADECHRELVRSLIREGFPPSRAGVSEMDLLDPDGAGYWRLVGTLKRALDPDGILAPGRYEPASASDFRSAAAAGSDS